MILNKDSQTFSNLWQLKNFNDFDYWHVNLQEEMNLCDVIPKEVYQKIKNSEVKLLLTCFQEGHTFIVDKLYESDLDPTNVVIFSDNKNITNKLQNLNNKPELYWSLIFELGIKIQFYLNFNSFNKIKTLEKKTYIKSFLNFNRRWRLHRPAMVALLVAHNLIDKGYVSLAAVTDDNLNWNTVFDVILNKLNHEKELYDSLISRKNDIVNLLNLYLDTTNLSVNRPRLIEDDIPFEVTKQLYENTYFSLVSETFFFDNDAVFFTEKTFKPIAFKHPFILISSPLQLDSLRELGYKTFHPFINESYDTELDDTKRLKLILKEVERLVNLTQNELFEFIDNVVPIVEHNYKVLLSKPHNGHLHKLV